MSALSLVCVAVAVLSVNCVTAAVETSYGQQSVRLLVVHKVQQPDTINKEEEVVVKNMKEVRVSFKLTLDVNFTITPDDVNMTDFNSDSQKNAVYMLAKENGIAHIEPFALIVARHFFKYPSVLKTEVEVVEKHWDKVQSVHPYPAKMYANQSFTGDSGVLKRCTVKMTNTSVHQTVGITGLNLIKVTSTASPDRLSGFSPFSWRSFTDDATIDHVLHSTASATWSYYHPLSIYIGNDYETMWKTVKKLIVQGFAAGNTDMVDKVIPDSSPLCFENIVHTMAKSILTALPYMRTINLELSNIHTYPLDLGDDNTIWVGDKADIYDVYTPVDAPYSVVSVTLKNTKHPGGNGTKPFRTTACPNTAVRNVGTSDAQQRYSLIYACIVLPALVMLNFI